MLERLKLALVLTVVTPVKPGAVHRLLESLVVERRIAEAVLVSEFMEEAYRRGEELAQGKRDARSLGLGRLVADAYRKVFEAADVKPVYGLDAAAVVLPALAGYAAGARRDLRSVLSQAITAILYRGGSKDTLDFIDGLEAVGASDLLLELENAGLSRRMVSLEDRPLGDAFEVLYGVDRGFALNLKGYSGLLRLASGVRQAKSLAAAVVASFIEALRAEGLAEVRDLSFRSLARLDRELRARGASTDGLLGLVFASTAIVAMERPDLPPA